MVDKTTFPGDSYSSFQSQPRGRFQAQNFFTSLVGWPLIVIGGHVVLQVLAWTFFAIIEVRGFIALPLSLSFEAKAHAHSVTLVATLISTVLAGASSFLFSMGLRKSLALALNRPIPLSTFFSSLKISSRGLIFDPSPSKRLWSLLSIVLVILTGVQTTGWSALTTPVGITIFTPVVGTELDLTSPQLVQMQISGELDYCVVNSTLLAAFVVGQTESGYAAVKDSMAFPASFTLMDQTFDVSTAGILPMTQDDVNATSWFSDSNITVIPATLNTTDGADPPIGVSANYSITQQGFTADVSCAFQDLSADSTPAISLQTDTVKDWENGVPRDNITFTGMNARCAVAGGLNSTEAYNTGDPASYVLMTACGPDSSGNYTLAFTSSGNYQYLKSVVCTLMPKITRVEVKYSDADLLAGTIDTTTLSTAAVEVNGPAGLSAVTTIANMMFFAQGLSTNIMGDQLDELIRELDGIDFQDDTILDSLVSAVADDVYALRNTLATYMQGVAEYSGSVLRACLSAKHGTFLDGVPSNMTTNSTGTLFTETVGWIHATETAGWVLIPGTLVALITIIVVLVTVANHASDEPLASPHGHFDPSNAMHLMAASAAGGSGAAFKVMEEGDLREAENVNVLLGHVPGRGPALMYTQV